MSFIIYYYNLNILSLAKYLFLALANQELSGAVSELQGGTTGVCSSYKRVGRPPFNCALRSMQMCMLYEVKHLRVKKYVEKMHLEARKTIFYVIIKYIAYGKPTGISVRHN